eukprot:2950761-Amphidinium_carterae.3
MESSGTATKSLSHLRKWMILVAHEVASKLYNYEEVSYKSTSATAPNINGECLPRNLSNPLEVGGSLPFKGIMTKEKGKSSWQSYSAKGLPALVGTWKPCRVCTPTANPSQFWTGVERGGSKAWVRWARDVSSHGLQCKRERQWVFFSIQTCRSGKHCHTNGGVRFGVRRPERTQQARRQHTQQSLYKDTRSGSRDVGSNPSSGNCFEEMLLETSNVFLEAAMLSPADKST